MSEILKVRVTVESAAVKKSDTAEEKEDGPLKPVTIVQKENVKKNHIKRIGKKTKTDIGVDYDTTPTLLIKLIERKKWMQAIIRCADYPDEAATWLYRLQEVEGEGEGEKNNAKKEDGGKMLPIHAAIVFHSPVEVIEALVDAYPQGLRKGDDRDMLPLHMAFRLGASPETTAVLVDAYPEALKKKDSNSHTPLHVLRAYKRKYKKEKERENKSKGTFRDKNRKSLIKFYLGGRSYGGDDDDASSSAYDSDAENDDDSDGDSIVFQDDAHEDQYDKLFYRGMFTDFGNLAVKGISSLPGVAVLIEKRRGV